MPRTQIDRQHNSVTFHLEEKLGVKRGSFYLVDFSTTVDNPGPIASAIARADLGIHFTVDATGTTEIPDVWSRQSIH